MKKQIWNYLAPDRRAMNVLLKEAVVAASGSGVRVAPFKRGLLYRVGVWLIGEKEEIEKVRSGLDARLSLVEIDFHAMLWEGDRDK